MESFIDVYKAQFCSYRACLEKMGASLTEREWKDIQDAWDSAVEYMETKKDVPLSVLKKIENQKDKIKQLEELVKEQKRQLQNCNESLRDKNLELDSYHHVWCDGGCEGGVNRYKNDELITEELVKTAENNVKRLRTWFENKKYRDKNE